MAIPESSQTITLEAQLPDDSIIVSKDYLQGLIRQTTKSLEWHGLRQASRESGIDTLKLSFILKAFRGALDVEKGGCVVYPHTGGKFIIEPFKFKEFYHKNFDLIQREYERRNK